jgi:transposase
MTLKQAISEISLRKRQNTELVQQNEALVRQADSLRHQIDQLQRRLYGPKSEQYHPDQLFLDELLKSTQAETPEPEPEVLVKATVRRKARPHGRLKLPEHMERVDVVLDLAEEEKVDPQTGQALIKLRDEISEKVAWDPGKWYVKRFVRPVYVHPERRSEKAGIYVAPMPDSPIAKCKADNSVLALVGVQKFVDHLPLYRQAQICKREGFDVSTSTINGWAVDPMLTLTPLVEAMKRDVLTRPCLFTDDTPLAMLQPGHGRTKTARMWVYVGGCGPPHRFFEFSEDRSGRHPLDVMSGYRGFVHADAYSGYDKLFATNRLAIEVGCWAHARRKFDEAQSSAVQASSEVLAQIRELYRIEKMVRGKSAEDRLAARKLESLPVLDDLYERFERMKTEALPASVLGKAIGYALNQREALYRFTTDGRVEIDNNTAENAIRPLALGRKNWLFAGSRRGGQACANALSLLQSAKAVGINPYDYLHDVYNRIMSYPVSRLDELLPHAWKLQH